ncbi:hypothetical protein PR001_g18206 [Phytophthora rubi]|uniref:Uncharacterized protein n=1 Tax=Phytophthora rubi TaxID=129364 RepID=A0A6A3KAM7_9STRA|nr:hypothetical protein PR001_g18206 [Phytophthora rubi]
MEDTVTRQHAHPNTVFHCLYGFYCLGYSRVDLAIIYNKAVRTIGNWINTRQKMTTNAWANYFEILVKVPGML